MQNHLTRWFVDTLTLTRHGYQRHVAIMLESIISAHERRVNKACLNSYKAYVKGKQKGKNK